MRHILKLHPDSQCDAVSEIEVTVSRPHPRGLALVYSVTGRIGDLCLPPIGAPVRTDGLWQHTCFEAFIRAGASGDYLELNFAPSTQWAAYNFSGYRSGMRVAEQLAGAGVTSRSSPTQYELDVSVDLAADPMLANDSPWSLNLSAVIEEQGGRKSWWALAHPPGKPDFHHSDCFALTLPAPSQP